MGGARNAKILQTNQKENQFAVRKNGSPDRNVLLHRWKYSFSEQKRKCLSCEFELAESDQYPHIKYLQIVPSSGSVTLIAKWTGPTLNRKTSIAYCKGGILQCGPNGTLKFLKKQKSVWNEIFQRVPPEPFNLLKGFHEQELTIGITVNGKLYKLILDAQHLDFLRLKEYDCGFKYFCLIEPLGRHILTVNTEDSVNIFCVESGQKISSIQIEDHTIIKANPMYPYLAVGTNHGNVILMSVLNVEQPKILTEFHLSHFPISSIVFGDTGDLSLVTDGEGNIFVMSGVPGDNIDVIFHTKEEKPTNFQIILKTNDEINFLGLSECSIMKYTISLENSKKDFQKNEIALPKKYTEILNVPRSENLFYAIKLSSKVIEKIRIHDKFIEVIDVIETNHHMAAFQISKCGMYLMTWGILDGLVTVIDSSSKYEVLTNFGAHNRHSLGTKIAEFAFAQ